MSLPSHWLLPLSINCPDCWGHESCNFLLASRGRASRMFAAGGTTRQLEEERGTNKRSLSAPGPTHQLSTSGSGVSSFKNIVCQHSTAVRVRTRGGNSRRTERSSSSRSLRRAAWKHAKVREELKHRRHRYSILWPVQQNCSSFLRLHILNSTSSQLYCMSSYMASWEM